MALRRAGGFIAPTPGVAPSAAARVRRRRLLARRLARAHAPALRGRRRLLLTVLLLGLLLVVALPPAGGAGAYAALLALAGDDLPDIGLLAQREVALPTQIVDRNGALLFEWLPEEGRRTPTPLAEIPAVVRDAVIATEDANFYENAWGVDPRGILRAAWQNLSQATIVSGGSTITQQLIKNVLLDPEERNERSLRRKAREVVLAYEISQRYSKDQILELYLNEIYFGNLSYGVGAAARNYFDKGLQDLSLAEAAVLAGLPQAPGAYNPLLHPQAALARQHEVLALMVNHGFIDQATADAARAEPVQFRAPRQTIRAPHFVWEVLDQVQELIGRETFLRGGLTIRTTLDLEKQTLAEKAIADHRSALLAEQANNAALVAVDPQSGDLLALVGSADYDDESIAGQFDVALATRQPGSTVKPITYALAFSKERGWGPGRTILDEPIRFPGADGQAYEPHNFDGRFHGRVTLRQALANSLNIPAVRLLQEVGVPNFVSKARALGLTTLEEGRPYGLSLTLGDTGVRLVDLVNVYATFAADGDYRPLRWLIDVGDSSGAPLLRARPTAPSSVFSPRQTYLVTSVLSDDAARSETYGAHSALELTRPAAAKTGTTDENRDAWTVGYTPQLVAGVWVGNTDFSPMGKVFGGSGPAQIWHDFMEGALAAQPPAPFEQPPGIVQADLCAETNSAPGPGCREKVSDLFIEELAPAPPPAPTATATVARRAPVAPPTAAPRQSVIRGTPTKAKPTNTAQPTSTAEPPSPTTAPAAPTSIPPTSVPPTKAPPTAVPVQPTAVPPTAAPAKPTPPRPTAPRAAGTRTGG